MNAAACEAEQFNKYIGKLYYHTQYGINTLSLVVGIKKETPVNISPYWVFISHSISIALTRQVVVAQFLQDLYEGRIKLLDSTKPA